MAPTAPGRDRGRWLTRSFRLGTSALLAVLVSSGCGGADTARSGPDDGPRVALLTAGPVSDAGWYAGAYEGLQLIRDSLEAQVSHQQTRTPAEFDEAFLSYADAGYDLVFAHGFEYQDAAIRAGAQFPDLTIVVSGGGRATENVIPLIFRLEDASYLAGMVAGALTRSGTVGMVGGVAIPPVQGTFQAFAAGAASTNPGVEVLESFIGNWDDVGAAKEATVAQLRQGADLIIHNTDAASFGVFQAVREATSDEHPAWAFGMNRDQNDVAPDVIVGSAIIDIPTAFLGVARAWQEGGLGDRAIYFGLPHQVVDFVPNPAQSELFSDQLNAALSAAREGIRAGSLTIPRVPFVEGDAGTP